MANSQIYPASPYPGAGDILTVPGSPNTTVTGWQNIPVSPTAPLDGEIEVYRASTNQWTPTTVTLLNNDSISINGQAISDDYWVFINRKDTEVQVNSPWPPNGFPILAAGSAVNTP